MSGGRTVACALGLLLAVWLFLPLAVGQPVSPVSLIFLSPPASGFAYGRAVALSCISSTISLLFNCRLVWL